MTYNLSTVLRNTIFNDHSKWNMIKIQKEVNIFFSLVSSSCPKSENVSFATANSNRHIFWYSNHDFCERRFSKAVSSIQNHMPFFWNLGNSLSFNNHHPKIILPLLPPPPPLSCPPPSSLFLIEEKECLNYFYQDSRIWLF